MWQRGRSVVSFQEETDQQWIISSSTPTVTSFFWKSVQRGLFPTLLKYNPLCDSVVCTLPSVFSCRRLHPCKTSPLVVLPCSLLKDCALMSSLQSSADWPTCRCRLEHYWHGSSRAKVLPLLKKAGLDRSSPANYRPISNLSTVSKILQRVVQARLRPHLMSSTNFSQLQSAHRRGHCTETALLDVLATSTQR